MLRVGALVAAVGQACREPVVPAATSPSLDIPPLDAGATAVTHAPGGVRFGHPLPRAGTAWRVVVHASSRASDSQGSEQLSTFDSEVRVEVLAVDGPAPSRVSMRFVRNVQTYQGQATPTLVDGKEYFVDARAPHVRDATNVAAPELEAQRVLDVFPDLGTRTRIDEMLPDEAMQVGERRDALAGAVLRVIHPRAWTLHAGTAVLARVDGEHAVFVVSLDVSSEGGLHMSVGGEARVGLHDAQLADLSLEGTYEPKGVDAGEPGAFSYRRKVTSEPAPRTGH